MAVDRVHVGAWHRAYTDFIPPDRFPDAEHDDDERLARWRERFGHPEVRTHVFDANGYVAGFCSAGGGELWALYVDPPAQGAGVGTLLLDHAESSMREAGTSEAVLWVYAENEPGRAFYEHRGWRLVEGSEQLGEWAAPHVEYRKRL